MSIAETYDNLLRKDPKELLNYLVEKFYVPLPEAIFTAADMEAASKLLIKLSGEYSYLTALLLYAKIAVRDTKRNGAKSDYEDMIDRRDTIEGVTNAVKQQYAAVSRAVTIHIENNQELRMNTQGYIKG